MSFFRFFSGSLRLPFSFKFSLAPDMREVALGGDDYISRTRDYVAPKITLTFFEENKMQYTIGPEGVEMVNAKDEVVFDMRCEDDLPVVEFINPKTNHRFSVRPQSNGDFVLEWKENNSVKMKISQKGVEIFGEEYTGLSIHDLKSGYFHRFPASSDGLTPTESGDVR